MSFYLLFKQEKAKGSSNTSRCHLNQPDLPRTGLLLTGPSLSRVTLELGEERVLTQTQRVENRIIVGSVHVEKDKTQ